MGGGEFSDSMQIVPNIKSYFQIPPTSALGPEDPAMSNVMDFQTALDSYLRKCTDTFNLERNCEVRELIVMFSM